MQVTTIFLKNSDQPMDHVESVMIYEHYNFLDLQILLIVLVSINHRSTYETPLDAVHARYKVYGGIDITGLEYGYSTS